MTNAMLRTGLLAGAVLLLPPLPLWAQPAPAVDTADGAETIVVFGRGETRQVAEVGQEQLRLQAPGSSPFRAIEKLPGVNFQSADP
jgi:iron complex outermembrane receptor protein